MSLKSSTAPTTARVFHSSDASPQPVRPSWSVSTLTNTQLRICAWTTSVRTSVIFIRPLHHAPYNQGMYHYNPQTALEELKEDAALPHPVHLRDMIVRSRLQPERAVALNRNFQDYLHAFGELQKMVMPVLEELARTERK